MAYIATLKKNNTVIYPQTKSTAVYEDDGVTVLDTVVVKKSTAAADANKMIKADGTKALVGASNIDFTTLPGNYSTSEIDTGYTWIDGSHIYKKTIDFGALPNNTTKSVNHGISNFNFATKIEVVAVSTNGNETIPLPLPSKASSSDSLEMSVTRTAVKISTSNSGYWSSTFPNCYVTLYYIKTS